MVIESVQNERVKKWQKLHLKKYRDETNLYIIENEHLIVEALRKDVVKEIIICDKNEDIFNFKNTFIVSKNVMNKLSLNVSSAKYIAVCVKNKEVLNLSNRILILDKIQDPGNFGTLLRSAYSFGFNQIICSKDCVDLYNEKTIRSTQGAMFHLNIIKDDLFKSINYLKENGYRIVSLTLDNSIFLKDLKPNKKMAFILGNEGSGIDEKLQKLSDERVKIEMSNFESLNVAIAGSIAMYMFSSK